MWYCTFFSVSNWDVSFVSVALMDILMMFFSLTCLLCIAYHIYFGINHVDHWLSFLALCLQLKVVLNVIPVLTLMLWCSWTRLPCEQCFHAPIPVCMHTLSSLPLQELITPLLGWLLGTEATYVAVPEAEGFYCHFPGWDLGVSSWRSLCSWKASKL